MTVQTRRRARDETAELSLPPPFTAVRLRELGDAFAHAQAIAPETGAGTLVHVGRFDLAEFALVLEPDEPLHVARRAFYAGMTAIADTLSAYAEPDTGVIITWPDAVAVNLGLVGGGRLAWPGAVAEDEVPPWLVFGGMIRIASMSGTEPGLNPFSTALEEEGFDAMAAKHVVEGFARHFMVALDAWRESGFAAVGRNYLQHLAREQGVRRELDENGDLLVRRMAKPGVERKSLIEALATPSWLDPATQGPRL
jgi:biotin-(acetyl-CoA carboxylase) ligase